ncbi:MAG: hypothetical protein KC417_01230, partial [Myxococcales bacterium]|nr:hypothetical protein [Myxococcales bacterium]
MMRAVLRRMWFAGAALAAFAVGCNPQDYVGDPSLHSFALDENTAPLLMAEDTAFYFIESRFEIPLLRPTDAQIRALYETPAPPFPRSPWVDRDDLPMEVDWTLTNLADTPIDATLTLNGINEFHE